MTTSDGPITVLVVDDDADLAEVTGMHLERSNDAFETLVEHGTDDAMATIDDDVDCVVSDYEMPERDGLDLLRAVRDYDAPLPFVLFTGRGSEEIASEAISAGVTDYLQKEAGTDQYAVLANRIENAVARRRSEAVAAESESRYRRLVESSPHAIFVHDGDENLFVNDRYAELVGADDADEVVGIDPMDFVHPADRDAIRARVRRVLDENRRNGWFESRLVTLDDEVRHVESCATPVVYRGTDASQVVVRDVTDKLRRERRLEALHEATRRLVTADDRQAVGDVALDVLENVFDEPVSGVWWYDADRGALAPLAATVDATKVPTQAGFEPGVDVLPDWSVETAVFESGEPSVVNGYGDREDTVTDAYEAAFFHPIDRHGLLVIASRDARSFDASERDLVGILARSVAAAFDRVEGADGS